VGQTAIDAIIQGRIKQNRFKSFYDLTEHVDLRVVNRKVLESLIKCGAFDSMGLFRSQLFAILENALASGNTVQRDRESGQSSFFAEFEKSGSAKSLKDVPTIPEWPDHEKLLYEKEMLGFYVTGHPLDRYKREVKSYSTVNTKTIQTRRDGEEVVIGGLVSKLKLTQTKKTGERMAIVGLEDLEGTMDMLVFPKTYKEHGEHLVKDAVLFFKGNVDKKEQDPKLLVNEIVPIAEAHKRFLKTVYVKLSTANGVPESTLKDLQGVLSQHPGSIPVYLEFKDQNNVRSHLLVDRSLFVKPDESLVSDLERMLGAEAVSFRA
jgi:DNA polymerase-3 subunit alpha